MLKSYIRPILYVIFVVIVYGVLYSQLPKDSFNFKDPIDPYYFSMTTISTVGLGDLKPKTTLAKMIVMSQMLMIAIGAISSFHED